MATRIVGAKKLIEDVPQITVRYIRVLRAGRSSAFGCIVVWVCETAYPIQIFQSPKNRLVFHFSILASSECSCCRRASSTVRSSEVRNEALSGQSTIHQYPTIAIAAVMDPSTMKLGTCQHLRWAVYKISVHSHPSPARITRVSFHMCDSISQ